MFLRPREKRWCHAPLGLWVSLPHPMRYLARKLVKIYVGRQTARSRRCHVDCELTFFQDIAGPLIIFPSLPPLLN